MGKSLQEQLLNSGIVNKKQHNKIKSEQRKEKKQKQKSGKQNRTETRSQLQQALNGERQRDKELNRQQHERKEGRAEQAQIRQLIERNRVEIEDGAIVYNFVYQGKIKKIHVSQKVKDQISQGIVAIVRWGEGFHLIPAEVAERIQAKNSDCLILYNDDSAECKTEVEDYPGHQVPDDLVW